MQFICRNLFILITILICIKHVCSGILVPRIENVKDKYSESDQHVQIHSTEETSVVKEDGFIVPLTSNLVQSFDVISKKRQAPSEKNKKTLQSTTAPEVRELFLGQEVKPLNRTRKSNPPLEPTVCFEFSSQNPMEPPRKVCEPINVARQTPNDVNIVSYNPNMGIPHSSTPLIVLPPYHTSQLNPSKTTVHPSRFPLDYGLQPAEDLYMSPPLYPVPTAQLPSSPPPTPMTHLNPANISTYSSSWFPDYGFQPAGDRYISPPNENMAPSQLPASLSPSPISEMNPVKTMLPSPWTSRYGFQLAGNRYMSLPNQYMNPAQLPISLPPPLMRQINPAMTILPSSWPPGYGFQPVENRYLSSPSQYMIPAQLPVSLPPSSMSEVNPAKTMLSSPWPSRYGFQPAENTYMSPPKPYMSSKQLTASLPPPFTSEMNPDRAMLPSSGPPGYGFQANESRYMSPPYYHFPSAQPPPRRPPSQMYYIHPSPPAYPVSYIPYPFSAFGNINKLQSPHPKTPVNASASKSGLLNTIKEQEEMHKVPTPLEEAGKSKGGLSSRSASTYPYTVPQQFPIIPYLLNMAYNEHLVESNAPVSDRVYPSYEYSPSTAAMHFTPAQSPSHVPVTTHTAKFGPSDPPAALTCRVHNSEEKEAKQILADDSIAILQLFLKPNPSRRNKYRESAPESVTNITGSSNARESVKRPMVQYAETANTSLQDDGLSDVRGSEAKVKEDWISTHGVNGIYEDKRNIEGMKWHEDQEQRAMQQYLEQKMTHRRRVGIPILQTVQPGAWHQGYFSASQAPIHSDRFYVDDYNVRQRPYYHPGHLPDHSRVPLPWLEVPQTRLWSPEYRQKTQFLPDQESPMNQELRNKQLHIKSNQENLHLQERLPDLKDNPSSESGQGKINETMEKQTRLNVVKAKLLQRYQSEAVEKRQRARQMSFSAVPKDTSSSSRSDNVQLNTSFPNMEKRKVSDIIGAAVQTEFENAVSRDSTTTDVSRNNIRDESATRPTQSNIKAVTDDSRPTSNKAKNLPGQAEMPVDSEQIPDEKEAKGRHSTLDTRLEAFGSTSTDEPLDIERTSTGNFNDGIELDGKTSHEDEGIAYGLEGRSSNQRTTTSYEISSYSEEDIAYTESNTPSWISNSQNENIQEGNINGDLTKYPEKTVTYAAERAAVPDILNDTSHNINQSTESTSFSDIRRKKESGQNALKINSADAPRASNISEDEFISKNQPLYKENGATIITSENKQISTLLASADTSDMLTKEPMKFKSETDVSIQEITTDFEQLISTLEPEFRNADVSEDLNNETDSSATKMKDIDFTDSKHSINDITGEGKMTPSDVLILNASRDSTLNKRRMHSDSKKMDANERTAEVRKPKKSFSGSLFTSMPAASVTTEILAQQRDMIPLNQVSDTQLTSDVIANPVATMLPEENTMRSVTWNSSSSNDRNENMLPNSTTSSPEIRAKSESIDTNSSDSQNYKKNSSGHIGQRKDSQISLDSNNPSSVQKASSKDSMYDQSNNNATEIYFENAETGRGSKSPSKTETQASTDSAAGETSNGTAEISDEISVISSDDGSSKTEEEAANVPKSLGDFKISYRMRSEAEEESRRGGIIAAQDSNTSNSTTYISPINSNKNQAELLGTGRNQKNRSSFTGHQMNSEGGFPQAPNNEQQMVYSQDGIIRNIKMNVTSLDPQFKYIPSGLRIGPVYRPPSVLPEAVRFLMYPNEVLPARSPHYTDNERGPGQLPNSFPYSYVYPIPLTPAYSLRPNPYIYSNNPFKNIYQDTGMPAERISGPVEKNINGQKIQGKLPFIVVLEQQ